VVNFDSLASVDMCDSRSVSSKSNVHKRIQHCSVAYYLTDVPFWT